MDWVRWQIFWLKGLFCLLKRRSSFGHLFIQQEEDGSWQIYKLSNSKWSASRAWSWLTVLSFYSLAEIFLCIKVLKNFLESYLCSDDLNIKIWIYFFFLAEIDRIKWCSTCQRWPYWLEEMMWLEFLQRILGNVLFSSHNLIPCNVAMLFYIVKFFLTTSCPQTTTNSQIYWVLKILLC